MLRKGLCQALTVIEITRAVKSGTAARARIIREPSSPIIPRFEMAGKMAGERFGLGALMRGTRTGMVRVEGLLEEGPGRRAGLKEGDLIVEVEGRRTRTLDELGAVLSEFGQHGKLVMMVKKDDGSMEEVVVEKDDALPLPRMEKRRSMERVRRAESGHSKSPTYLDGSSDKATKVVVVCRRDHIGQQQREDALSSPRLEQTPCSTISPRPREGERGSADKQRKERKALGNLSNLPPSSARSKARRSAEMKESRRSAVRNSLTKNPDGEFVCLVEDSIGEVKGMVRGEQETSYNYDEISQEIYQMQHLLSQSSRAIADIKQGLGAAPEDLGKRSKEDFDIVCEAVEKYKTLLAECNGRYQETAEKMARAGAELEEAMKKLVRSEEEISSLKQALKEETERLSEREEEVKNVRREKEEEVGRLKREREQVVEKLRREKEEELWNLTRQHEEQEDLKREKEQFVEQWRREKDELMNALRRKEEEIAVLRGEKEQEAEKLWRKHDELNALRREKEEQEEERAREEREHEQTRAELLSREEELKELGATLEAMEMERQQERKSEEEGLKKSMEELETVQEELKSMKEVLKSKEEELEEAKEELEARRKERKDSQAKLEQLKKEMEEMQRKEEQARAEQTNQAEEEAGEEEARGQARKEEGIRSMEREVKRLRAVLEANSLAAARREEVRARKMWMVM